MYKVGQHHEVVSYEETPWSRLNARQENLQSSKAQSKLFMLASNFQSFHAFAEESETRCPCIIPECPRTGAQPGIFPLAVYGQQASNNAFCAKCLAFALHLNINRSWRFESGISSRFSIPPRLPDSSARFQHFYPTRNGHSTCGRNARHQKTTSYHRILSLIFRFLILLTGMSRTWLTSLNK